MLDAGFTPLLSQILLARGVSDLDQAVEILKSDTSLILDPMGIDGMQDAVKRINTAIENCEKVAVYGDYDVDGITSTCLLTDYLRSRGLDVTPYIPDRTEEGYGLNTNALKSFADNGITLVVTVDCGITACEEAKRAKELGIDMIITDHHECKLGELPDASAIIDCKQPSDNYPNKNLAGVGMAFKFVCAIEGTYETVLDKYCDYIAIGTIADVMSLDKENRCYVTMGLEKLRREPRYGIKAILDAAKVAPSSLNASSISFVLSPRINAAGRLNRANLALELLMSDNMETATKLADEICELNRQRQDIETYIWQKASAEVGKVDTSGPIVLSSSEWHQGVIGIAASRLAEQYNVPTIMIYINEGRGKGSCRSYGGFNLFEALKACSSSLESFGGHALAAGLNIREDMIPEFRARLTEYYHAHKPENVPKITCDLLITDPKLLTIENVKSIDQLEPFGNGNQKPVLCMSGAVLEEISEIGNGRHLRMTVSLDAVRFTCIFFSHNLNDVDVRRGDIVDIAFTPQINEYYGNVSVQLVLSGIRKHCSDDMVEDILDNNCRYKKVAAPYCPEREDFKRVWRSISEFDIFGNTVEEILSMSPSSIAPEMYCLCLKAFREAGLISSIYGGHIVKLDRKADLEGTEIMMTLRKIRGKK